MGKYTALNVFLTGRHEESIVLTFDDIETVIGSKLPRSKRHRAWWSNNPDNNVMTREWLDAGYETESVDIAGERLTFRKRRRAGPGVQPTGFAEEPQAELSAATRPRHPGIGFMRGLIKFAPGFDGTGPYSDEPWDEGYLGEDRVAEGNPKGQSK